MRDVHCIHAGVAATAEFNTAVHCTAAGATTSADEEVPITDIADQVAALEAATAVEDALPSLDGTKVPAAQPSMEKKSKLGTTLLHYTTCTHVLASLGLHVDKCRYAHTSIDFALALLVRPYSDQQLSVTCCDVSPVQSTNLV